MSDTKKLPVFASLGEVLSGVTRHYVQLLVVAWPAVIIILASAFVLGWQYYEAGVFQAYVSDNGGPDLAAILAAQQKLEASEAQVLIWIAQFGLMLASAVAAVRWHRFVLFGEGANGFGGIKLLRKEDGLYIWATIKMLGVMLVAIAVVVALIMLIGMLKPRGVLATILAIPTMIFVIWLYLGFLRIMLALPDASVGQGGRVFAVFRASAGNGWRLLGLAMLVGLSMIAIMFAIALVIGLVVKVLGLGLTTSPAALAVAAIVYLGIYLYFLMAQITMLSVAYREIIGLPAASGDVVH